MARIRSIKPGYNKSLDIVPLSIPCRYHFALLWTYADDEGRGLDHPALIRADLWPLDPQVTEEQIETWHDELAKHARIVRYTDGERRFFEVCGFKEHQKPNRPVESKLPSPESLTPLGVTVDSRTTHAQSSEPAVSQQGALIPVVEGRGEVDGGGGEIAPAAPTRHRDLLFETILEVCELNQADLTDSARGAANRATKALRAVDASPAGIRMRADNFRSRWPDVTLTPSGLAKQWAQCATAAAPVASGKTAAHDRSRDNVITMLKEAGYE